MKFSYLHPPCNVEPLLELLAENTPFLNEGEREGYGLFCSPKLPHLRTVFRKCFEVPSVAWAKCTSLKKAVLHGQEFPPLPFSTLPHYLLSNSATSKLPMCYLPALPYTDRGTLRLPYPPYHTNWSLAPKPQNGRRATFLRSLTRTGGSLILPSPLYPTTCSQTSHH